MFEDSFLQRFPIFTFDEVRTSSYLDFFKFKEIKYPVVTGKDIFDRNFIVVKMKVTSKKSTKIIMQTFFQRYGDSNELWMGCGHATINLINTHGGMGEEQFKLIKDIVNGKTIILNNGYRLSSSKFNGCQVSLFDQEKEKAAMIIQKYWKRSIYDPSYKLCKIIQIKRIREIEDSCQKSILD